MTFDSSFAPTPRRALRFTTRQMFLGLCLACMTFALCGGLGRAARDARRAALRSNTNGCFCQVILALHNYHDVHGCFPPAYLADEHGRPMHSWRVLILPYLEHGDLFNEYDFNEPWDGPNNSRLHDRMPEMFWAQDAPHSASHTNIVALVGPGTAFPGASSTRLADISDGSQNTILLAETSSRAIPWLAPQDLDVREMSWQVGDSQRPSISSVPWRDPFVAMASGERRALSRALPASELRALATIAGGESVARPEAE